MMGPQAVLDQAESLLQIVADSAKYTEHVQALKSLAHIAKQEADKNQALCAEATNKAAEAARDLAEIEALAKQVKADRTAAEAARQDATAIQISNGKLGKQVKADREKLDAEKQEFDHAALDATKAMDKRQAALDVRENDLKKREAEVAQRTAALDAKTAQLKQLVA